MIDTTKFNSQEDLFRFLIENKSQLIAQKKFEMKRADAFSHVSYLAEIKDGATKAEVSSEQLLSQDTIRVKAVINTTGLLDSHGDVHVKGLWKKTIRENKNPYHLQEHVMSFSNVISDEVHAYTKEIPWRDLGYDVDGTTEALMFDSEVRKDRNEFMFEQYAKRRVKNHSVGMQYVNLFLCVNSEDEYYKEEKSNWDKYIEEVANKKEAESKGYFWAVTEAKMIEGSAVLFGSNWITPTQSVKEIEPSNGTQSPIPEPASPLNQSLFEKIGCQI